MQRSQQIFGPIHQIGDQISTPAFTAPATEVTWKIDDRRTDPEPWTESWWFKLLCAVIIGVAFWQDVWVVIVGIVALLLWAYTKPMAGCLEVIVAYGDQEYAVHIEGYQLTSSVMDRLEDASAPTEAPLKL